MQARVPKVLHGAPIPRLAKVQLSASSPPFVEILPTLPLSALLHQRLPLSFQSFDGSRAWPSENEYSLFLKLMSMCASLELPSILLLEVSTTLINSLNLLACSISPGQQLWASCSGSPIQPGSQCPSRQSARPCWCLPSLETPLLQPPAWIAVHRVNPASATLAARGVCKIGIP